MADTPARKKSPVKKASVKKSPVKKKSPIKKASAVKKSSPAHKSTSTVRATTARASALTAERGIGLAESAPNITLATLRENRGARPKRTRVGRGHGSGMVKTGGEGGKGQTVRSGGGKGPAFEGGQTPWARRLPHKRGYSQKARDIGHFRTSYAVVNISALETWDASVEVSPESLVARKLVTKAPDGIKILGGNKAGVTVPSGLRFRDVVFSNTAREALVAAGANLGEEPAV